MGGLIFLFYIGLGFVAIVLPLIAYTKASRAEHDLDQLAGRARRLEHQIDELKQQLRLQATQLQESQPAKPAREEALVQEPHPVPASTPIERIPPPLPIPSLAAKTASTRAAQEPAPVRTAEQRTPPTPKAQPARKSPLENINWEQFMGVRLFAWLGGFALFLAAAFFLKYSFDRGLIPPTVRVAMGFLTGVGLLIGGVRMSQKRYKITADTLSATGVVILYAVTFACRAVYEFPFFGVITTFLLMTLITAVAFFVAVRLNAMVVAVLGLLGGFLTPVLVGSGHDNPFGLFSYIAFLDVGLLAVAYARRWDWLNLAGAIGTVLMQFGWTVKFFAPEKVFIAMAIYLGFCALYLGTAIWSRRRDHANPWLIGASLLMPAATFLFVLRLIADDQLGSSPGIIYSFILGADLAVLALATVHFKASTVSPAAPENIPGIPALGWLNQIGGGIVFLLLAIWTGVRVGEDLLFWALGGYFAFSLLHTAYPIFLQRRFPEQPVPIRAQLFPILGLLMTLFPIVKLEDVSFMLWSFVLLIDLLAIGAAVIAASITGIVIALLATAAIAFIWLLRLPSGLIDLPEALVVIAGMSLVFTVAGMFAGRKILELQQTKGDGNDSGLLPSGWTTAELQRQIPALSGIMPFLLLLLVTGRVPLENPSPIFGVGLLLVALFLGLARWQNMTWLPAVGLGCSALLELGWHSLNLITSNAPLAVGWYLVFFVVFTAYPFVFHRRDGSKMAGWVSSALSGPIHFILIYDVVRRIWPTDFMGVIPALFAVPALAAVWGILQQIPREQPQRNAILAWFGGVALLFITLIFPIQFDREWLTISWALEGAALLWLFHRVPHHGLRHVGTGLLLVSFVRLALNPTVFAYHPRAEMPLLNWYLYIYGVAIAAHFVGARLLVPPNHQLFQKDARALLVTLGTVLCFLLMNIEIADFFTRTGERVLTFSFSGNFARDMTYTISWALFAFVLLVIGILRRIRPARWAGIGLLAVTLLKLFFHDLATLNQLYRVGALVGVAVVAIIASFLYQKFLATTLNESDTAKPAGLKAE